jgi:hypothetical protein
MPKNAPIELAYQDAARAGIERLAAAAAFFPRSMFALSRLVNSEGVGSVALDQRNHPRPGIAPRARNT